MKGMPGFYEINHKGKKIFCLDITGLQCKDKDKIRDYIESARSVIRLQAEKSVLHITNVSNTGFNSDISSMMRDYAAHNTPYIKASAIVGVTGLQKIIYQAIKKFTGRDFHLTETMEDAKEWLAGQ
jgi:ribosomal protein S20